MSRRKAEIAVEKGHAAWIEDGRTREMVCHFIEVRVASVPMQSPNVDVTVGHVMDSGYSHPWAYWPTGEYDFGV